MSISENRITINEPHRVILARDQFSIEIIGKDNPGVMDTLLQRFPKESIVNVKQVHGTEIFRATNGNWTEEALIEADAIITNEKGLALVIRTADCLPLFFAAFVSNTPYGPEEIGMIGIIHAGWKGMAAGIVSKTLDLVTTELNPRRVDCFIGPCISKESFEVGDEVAERFQDKEKFGPKWHVDLVESAKRQIADSLGSRTRFSIDTNSFTCTMKTNEVYYSHRKGDTGRNLNIIYIGDAEWQTIRKQN